MHGEPQRVAGHTFHAMPHVRRNESVVSRTELYILPVFHCQRRRTLEQDYPFRFRLIVPESIRTGLPMRHDLLDAYAIRRKERFDPFAMSRIARWLQKIANCERHEGQRRVFLSASKARPSLDRQRFRF